MPTKMEAVLAKQERLRQLEAMPAAPQPILSPAERSARDINVIKRVVLWVVFIMFGLPAILWLLSGLWIASVIK